jgi:hypothetical protein
MKNSIKNNEFFALHDDKKTLYFIDKLFVVNDDMLRWIQVDHPQRGIHDRIGSYRIRVDALKNRVLSDLFGYKGFTPTEEEMQELDVLYDDIVMVGDGNWSLPKFLRRILMEEAILTEPDLLEQANFLCNELLDRVNSRK